MYPAPILGCKANARCPSPHLLGAVRPGLMPRYRSPDHVGDPRVQRWCKFKFKPKPKPKPKLDDEPIYRKIARLIPLRYAIDLGS
jgi:hypothetical protein